MIINNPNTEARPGDILWGVNNHNKIERSHYMVFIEPVPSEPSLFYGVMLTGAKSEKFSNIPIPGQYFKTEDERLETIEFPRKDTLLRPRKHYKMIEWSPFVLHGTLTEEGLNFVIEQVMHLEGMFYEDNV